MARFKVVSSWRKKIRESEIVTESQAYNVASQWLRDGHCKTLVILRDSEGEDHPANAGKFFTHQIWK